GASCGDHAAAPPKADGAPAGADAFRLGLGPYAETV
ncbi:MAG: hypothetical protein AVDCRST_MAG86-3134, partial [uncultured Truepera sp.]